MRITPGETLRIDRRRRGLSIPAEAERRGLTEREWRHLETDRTAPWFVLPLVMPLAQHEILYLRRTRAGISQTDLARTLGLSRFWLGEKERGRAVVTAKEVRSWPK